MGDFAQDLASVYPFDIEVLWIDFPARDSRAAWHRAAHAANGLDVVHVHFEVGLKSGGPSNEDADYIIERMQHCPVSTNLKQIQDGRTRVDFFAATTN